MPWKCLREFRAKTDPWLNCKGVGLKRWHSTPPHNPQRHSIIIKGAAASRSFHTHHTPKGKTLKSWKVFLKGWSPHQNSSIKAGGCGITLTLSWSIHSSSLPSDALTSYCFLSFFQPHLKSYYRTKKLSKLFKHFGQHVLQMEDNWALLLREMPSQHFF